MGVALRHDWRLMPQEPLHLIQVYPGLHHSRRERMAKIVEMEIVDLRTIERGGQSSPDVAPIEECMAFAVKDEINHPSARRVFTFQEIKHGRIHRDRPSLAVFRSKDGNRSTKQIDTGPREGRISPTVARWTILSSNAVTPSGRCRPSAFGMYTLRTGFARYAPRFSLAERSWRCASSASP